MWVYLIQQPNISTETELTLYVFVCECLCLCDTKKKNDWFHWDNAGGLLSWWFMCLLLPFPHPALRMQSTGRLQLFREHSQCVCVCFSMCVCVYISSAEFLMQHCASGSQDYVLKSRQFITSTLVDILPENCFDTACAGANVASYVHQHKCIYTACIP